MSTKHRLAAVALALTVCVSTTSCVLRESNDYVVQPAPPSGIHVTIKLGPSQMLKLLSGAVAAGIPVNDRLRAYGVPTRCDAYANTASNGDLCAFRVLGDFETEGALARAANRLYWSDAVADDEFSDFRNDALARVRPTSDNTTCVHATIRNYGDWPIEWRETNWTIRTRSGDSKCR